MIRIAIIRMDLLITLQRRKVEPMWLDSVMH